MVATLLVFSLLLHFVTFYIIIVLFQRMNHLKNLPNVDTVADLELMLQDHLEAVRRENQALIDSIDKNHGINVQKGPKTAAPLMNDIIMPKPFTITPKTNQPDVKQKTVEDDRNSHSTAYTPPVEDVTDKIERSTTSEVLHLHEKGYTSQDIAKKLHIGKGEVELMINLNRKRQ